MEGPETVAAVFLEPVQNAGGCFVPPPGYFQRVREICDRYGVLLVSDEVICAFGRLGTMFGCERYDYLPDMITSAKGLTCGYSPLGAVICRDRLAEPFLAGTRDLPARHHVRRPPGELRGRAAPTSTCSRGRTSSATCGPTRPSSERGSTALRDLPDRRRRPRRRLLLAHRAREGPGHQGRVRPTTSASELLRGFLSPAPVRGGPDLPRRRPRRPGHPARRRRSSPGPRSSTRSRRSLRTVPDRGVEARLAADGRGRPPSQASDRRRRPARGQGRRAPRRHHARRRARARRTTASTVLVEAGAGVGSAITDDEYARGRRRDRRRRGRRVGARRHGLQGEGAAGRRSSRYLRPELVLFTYLHLAAYPEVADALLERGVTGIAYETVQTARRRAAAARADERGRRAHGDPGRRPLPRARERRARRAARRRARRAARRASWCSAPATSAGTRRGSRRAWRPRSLLLDKNLDRLRWVDQIHQGRIVTLASNRGAVERAVADADLVIGAVLVPAAGRRWSSPTTWCAAMKPRRGDRRRRRRPGRLHRDDPRDHPRRPGLRGRTASSTTRSATCPARCRTRRPTR